MKTFKAPFFILLILIFSGGGVLIRQEQLKREKREKPHPLDLLPSSPTGEAILLRKAKDLITYGRYKDALNILNSSKFESLKCWGDYFKYLASAKMDEDEGWEGLLKIHPSCPSRKFALDFLVENAPVRVLEKIPIGELKGEKRAELEFKLGKLGRKEIYCSFPSLAEKFSVKIKKPSRLCRRKRFNYFIARGRWTKAYREAYTRWQKAQASFAGRKYSRTVYLLRRPRGKQETLLLFRALLRAGLVARAVRMSRAMEKMGLGEEYLWKMAMFYYPEERGFSLFREYLKKYPGGKYSQKAKNYLELREKCLKGGEIEGQGVETVEFALPSPTSRELNLIKKAGILASAFLYREAERELEYALEKSESRLLRYYLGAIYYRAGKYLKGLKTIISVFKGLPDDARTLRLIYPFPMREKIERIAFAQGINPFLVAALIHQESLFNPEARSYAGAVGLLQLTRRTFNSTVARMGGGFSNPWDAHENLIVGIRHFSELVNYYGGVIEYALAAYNAGIKRVDRWRKYLPCKEPGVFVELIPIEQTRNYVKSILRKMKIYRRLYDNSGASFRWQVLGARDLHNIR